MTEVQNIWNIQILLHKDGTHDGFPIIGQHEEFPNCYFLMAYGDNGAV